MENAAFQKKVAVKCKKTVGSNVIDTENLCGQKRSQVYLKTTLICVTRI